EVVNSQRTDQADQTQQQVEDEHEACVPLLTAQRFFGDVLPDVEVFPPVVWVHTVKLAHAGRIPERCDSHDPTYYAVSAPALPFPVLCNSHTIQQPCLLMPSLSTRRAA